MHGGTSTGPRTPEGLARCTAAATKHGRRNAAARAQVALRGEARSMIAALRRVVAEAEAAACEREAAAGLLPEADCADHVGEDP